VREGHRIGNGHVDLSLFKGCGITCVIHTQEKTTTPILS
jgi:hypothetical protein